MACSPRTRFSSSSCRRARLMEVPLPRPQLLLHVHDVDLGQGLLVVALPQGEAAVAAALGGVHGLHRRSGRAQQQQGVLLHAAVLGHLPGMVAGVVLRLIAGLLLLVQDDES